METPVIKFPSRCRLEIGKLDVAKLWVSHMYIGNFLLRGILVNKQHIVHWKFPLEHLSWKHQHVTLEVVNSNRKSNIDPILAAAIIIYVNAIQDFFF